MATDPDQHKPVPVDCEHGESLAKWLLGVLGVLWVGGMALRFLRGERSGAKESDVTYAASASRRLRPLPHPMRGHESRDINVKWIFGLVIFLFVSGLAIHGILGLHLSALNHGALPTDRWQPAEAAVQTQLPRPPMPALQVSPPLDLQAFQAREQTQLHTYGWINRSSGIVRVPIEQAMEKVLQQGFPTRNASEANQAGPSSYQLIQRRLDNREPEIRGQK